MEEGTGQRLHLRDLRLDAIKAGSMVLVFIWHLQPLKVDSASNGVLTFAADRLIRLFNFELTLIAVPAFFLVSLYLRCGKLSESPGTFPRRLAKLVGLYLLWSGVQVALYRLLRGEFPAFDYQILRNGGPGLPIVGGSVFYFLFDLIFLYLFLAVFFRMPDSWKRWVGAALFLLSAARFEVAIFSEWLQLDFHDMLNFLYLVPLAFLLFRSPQVLVRRKWWFLAAYGLLVIHDLVIKLLLTPYMVQLPTYGRLSVAAGTIAFCCFMLDARIHPKRWIILISQYSLGIFAIHKYCQLAAHYLIPDTGYYSFFGLGVHLQSLGIFFLAAFLTVFALWLIRLFGLKAIIV